MSIESIFSIFLGIGLAASAGFRVFIPLFALSLGTYFGVIPLNEKWAWLGSETAMLMLGIAVIAESVSYLVPFVDNALDSLAVPLAGVAGTALVAATMTDMSPAATWAIAIIGGGGAATAIKTTAATGRVVSTATTAGVANPVISVTETITAVIMSVLSLFLPVLAIIAVVLLFFLGWKVFTKARSIRTGNSTEQKLS